MSLNLGIHLAFLGLNFLDEKERSWRSSEDATKEVVFVAPNEQPGGQPSQSYRPLVTMRKSLPRP